MYDKFSIFTTLRQSTALYLRSYISVFGWVLLLAVVELLAPMVAQYWLPSELVTQINENKSLDLNQLGQVMQVWAPIVLVTFLLSSFFNMWIYLILYAKLTQRNISFIQNAQVVWQHYLNVILLRIIVVIGAVIIGIPIAAVTMALGPYGFICIVLAIAFIMPKIILSEWLIIARQLGPIAALKKNIEIVQGRQMHLIGCIFFLITIASFFTLALNVSLEPGSSGVINFLSLLIFAPMYQSLIVICLDAYSSVPVVSNEPTPKN